MELWKLILIALASVFLVNFLLKKVAFIIRALLIIAIILVIVYFFKDTVVGLLVK
mgnify:CR=1 FL=1